MSPLTNPRPFLKRVCLFFLILLGKLNNQTTQINPNDISNDISKLYNFVFVFLF